LEWVTTSTVLQRLRDGEEPEAWHQFVERFRAPVVQFGRLRGLAELDAEDAAQEAFVAFLEAYREGRYDRQRGRLSQWLFGFADRCIRRARRERGAVPLPAAGVLPVHVDLEAPDASEQAWEEEWERALLQECIRRARPEFRPPTFRAFELAVREKRPAAEIAAELGVDVKSVYNAKHRVIQRIREIRRLLEEVDA
jgi:RNA polymerase sigma-70 factor (ECF subfamily)